MCFAWWTTRCRLYAAPFRDVYYGRRIGTNRVLVGAGKHEPAIDAAALKSSLLAIDRVLPGLRSHVRKCASRGSGPPVQRARKVNGEHVVHSYVDAVFLDAIFSNCGD
jgi:hypothetical protein